MSLRVHGSLGFRVFRVFDAFGVGLGFGVEGLGSRGWGLGLRVWGVRDLVARVPRLSDSLFQGLGV